MGKKKKSASISDAFDGALNPEEGTEETGADESEISLAEEAAPEALKVQAPKEENGLDNKLPAKFRKFKKEGIN